MVLTHAGAVAFRKIRKQVLFLVITSSTGENWVLPKGHIIPGESSEQTALRELKEETGVVGEIVSKLSLQRFDKNDETAFVQYFLVRAKERLEIHEKRSVRWEGEKEALRLLTFDDSRKVLKQAAKSLRRRPREPQSEYC